MAFDLINQILRDPNILMNDEANWQASRVRMAIEQIPEGIFPFYFRLRKVTFHVHAF